MWTILITLVCGFIIGYLDIIPKHLQKYIQWFITGGLMILLISMGAGISSNREILSKLSQLGFKALVLAIASVVGSILLVWVLEKYLFSTEKGDENQWSG